MQRARGVLIFLILSFSFAAGAAELTVVDLLKGSKIPLKREFPLSKKIKPCEDFHRYVCETAEKSFHLPKDRSRWFFSFSDSAERLLDIKKNYFKKLAAGLEPKLPRTLNVVRAYQACMNVPERKKEEVELVRREVEKIGGAKDLDSLRAIVNDRLLTPQAHFVAVFDATNQDNPDRYDATVMADGMTLPERSYYHDKKAVEDLRALAVAFFKELKLDQVNERAAAVVEFERGFAEVHPLPADMRKLWSENTYVKRDELKKNYPHIGWTKVFSQIPDKISVRNVAKNSMAYVDQYLANAKAQDLQSVMLFQSLLGFMDDAYPKFYKVYHEFNRKHHGGPPVRPPRDERCTQTVMGELGKELDAELIEIVFPGFDGAKVRDVAESIRKSILAGLKRNTWLTEAARKEALNKVERAELRLMKPENEKNWNFIEIGELSDSHPIENHFAIGRAGIAQMLGKMRADRNRMEWFTGPLTVNAFYSADDNQFVLPQGILQFPFYDPGQSRIENVAAMGMVIGHELGHGVDDEGSKYDSKGKLRQWMTEADLKAFRERGAKLIDQFNRAGHDGKLTLGENIGDNVGMSFSLETAFPEPEKASVEDLKKFFESYARMWCAVQRPEQRKVALKTDPHAQPDARINEQVVHRDLFYKAYACKAGDKMYLAPEDRVQVW